MRIIRIAVFFVILGVIYKCLTWELMYKCDRRSLSVIEYFSQDKRHDIVAVGPSYVFCTFNPMTVYEKLSLNSYALGVSAQPADMTYYFVKKALERSRPKLIILEDMFFLRDVSRSIGKDEFIHTGVDFCPVDFDKLNLLFGMSLPCSIESYLFPLIKYHSNWKSYTSKSRLLPNVTMFNGFAVSDTAKPGLGSVKLLPKESSNMSLGEYNMKVFNNIRDAVKDAGCELLVIFTPIRSNTGGSKRRSSFRDYLIKEDVDFLDLCEQSSLCRYDEDKDYIDINHLNVFGATKATSRICDYIRDHYKFESCMSDKDRSEMDAKLIEYHKRYDAIVNKK